ncbi:MAG: methyltransferase [Pseudomonadota bacterium]
MARRGERPADRHDMAAVMRTFYERHPYPPPIRDLSDYRRLWQDPARLRAEAALYWPDRPFRDDRRILVAGCGTSQAARHAVRWPNASVTGIDMSEASVRATERLKRTHKLDNLKLRQCRIEEATDLGEFDYIVCTGVLHHLPDPDTGLRALRDMMAPRAAMQIMVYAPYGRVGVYMMQDYFRRIGLQPTANGVKAAQGSLGILSRDHPLAPLLGKSPDFGTEAGFADALLNPVDRPYSVPDLFEFLEKGGLKFGRWLRQAPYLFECGSLAQSPDRKTIAKLPPVDRYAAAELFRGTMVEHTTIAYRDDLGEDPQDLAFGTDQSETMIPHRVATSVTVTERLPEGAAAVLINRAHSFTDLYLPVDAGQLAAFEAIDGTRSVADVVAGTVDPEAALAFLQTLWRYDQVVFESALP